MMRPTLWRAERGPSDTLDEVGATDDLGALELEAERAAFLRTGAVDGDGRPWDRLLDDATALDEVALSSGPTFSGRGRQTVMIPDEAFCAGRTCVAAVMQGIGTVQMTLLNAYGQALATLFSGTNAVAWVGGVDARPGARRSVQVDADGEWQLRFVPPGVVAAHRLPALVRAVRGDAVPTVSAGLALPEGVLRVGITVAGGVNYTVGLVDAQGEYVCSLLRVLDGKGARAVRTFGVPTAGTYRVSVVMSPQADWALCLTDAAGDPLALLDAAARGTTGTR